MGFRSASISFLLSSASLDHLLQNESRILLHWTGRTDLTLPIITKRETVIKLPQTKSRVDRDKIPFNRKEHKPYDTGVKPMDAVVIDDMTRPKT
jgi:hypothetical protein